MAGWRAGDSAGKGRLGALFLAGLILGPAGVAAGDGSQGGDAAAAAIIETVAGGGGVGDGGAATAARLSLPGGVAVAPEGDLVVVDFGHHRVRWVDAETGLITTVAGTGEPGFAGDGGPAVRSRLARPENAAFGPDGDLFIVDSHNHRIRRLDRCTGVITTVAGVGEAGFSGDGGPALHARLYQPEGIAIDARGNLFVGDTLNGRIRRVDAATGVITTVAGSGEIGTSPDGTPGAQARFLRLARLAVDRAGNLLIADSPSHKIQLLDAATRRLRTLAGTGIEGFSGDGGPAILARLSFPEGVTLDPSGDVYFADLGNHRVRRIDAHSGVITTVAGTGERGFSGDGGPATAARLWSPGRLAFDRRGNLFIADILNARVRRLDRETGVIETVVGSGSRVDGAPAVAASLAIPGDLAYRDGRLYLAEYGNRRVLCVDLATERVETVAGGGLATGEGIDAATAELKLPEAIALGPGGRLYIADSLAHRVWRVELGSRTLHTLAGTGEPGVSGDGGRAVEARLKMPGAVAVGDDGTVYIGDFGNRRIRAVAPDTGVIRSLSAVADGDRPLETSVVSLAAAGERLYWLATADPDVHSLDLATGRHRRLQVALPYRDPEAAGFQLGDLVPAGRHLFLADTLAHRVVRLDRRTGRVEVAAGDGVQGFAGDGGPASRASLFRPGGLAAGPAGELFIADTFNHRVRRVRPGGGGD